jgi:hypothetical protein
MSLKYKPLNELQIKHLIECVLENVEIIGKREFNTYCDILQPDKDKLVKYFIDFLNSDDDICPSCFARILDEDYFGTNEKRSDYGSEFVVEGFKCHVCGNKEYF